MKNSRRRGAALGCRINRAIDFAEYRLDCQRAERQEILMSEAFSKDGVAVITDPRSRIVETVEVENYPATTDPT